MTLTGRKVAKIDWAFMRDYCLQLGDALGIPMYFSWLEGGF